MPKVAKHSENKIRLKRIEGQVRGVVRMVDEERYCIDIIHQLTAVRRAVDQVSLKIMKGHINSCVSNAIHKRNGARKVDELMQTIHQFVK